MTESSNGNEKLPPGPKGRRFSNLWKRFRDTAGLFEELQREYGDLVFYELPSRKCCAIYDADLIREVLVVQQSSFVKTDVGKSVMRCPTLLTADGNEHRRRRKLVQPCFGKKNVEAFAGIVIKKTSALQNGWRNGQTIDMKKELHRLALNIATEAFFGEEMQVAPGLVEKMLDALNWKMKSSFLPFGKLISHLPLPPNVRARRAIAAMDEVISHVIRKAHNETKEGTNVISLLVHAKDEEGIEASFTDEEVREDAYILLAAGHETCTNALAWCLSQILRNPAVRNRLEQEVDDVVGGRQLTVEDYREFPYARAVFNETLRLMPPIHYVGRTATKDCVIGDYLIPKGTVVQPVLRLLHMNETHFPQAREFKPERWLEEPPADRPKHAYLPFGSGSRICIGWEFAIIQGILILASLAQRWRLEAVSRQHAPEVNSMALYVYRSNFPVTLGERQGGRVSPVVQ